MTRLRVVRIGANSFTGRVVTALALMAIYLFLPNLCGQDRVDRDVMPAVSSPGGLSRAVLTDPPASVPEGHSPLRFEMPRIQDSNWDGIDQGKNDNRVETMDIDGILNGAKGWTTQLPSVLMMAGLTFLPAALLMTTSFVRIQITLGLLRQALGSPTIPGNQVIVALSLLLSLLVMQPVGYRVHEVAIVPYQDGRMTQAEAIRAGVEPIKRFMVAQILHTGHAAYLEELSEYAKSQDHIANGSATQGSVSPVDTPPATDPSDLPLHVVAPAFLLSELTTALVIGFAVYLPFLIVDLVVATLLAAMGIWMMPPSLVSTPAKLILFVLADGWMLTAGALVNGFVTS